MSEAFIATACGMSTTCIEHGLLFSTDTYSTPRWSFTHADAQPYQQHELGMAAVVSPVVFWEL